MLYYSFYLDFWPITSNFQYRDSVKERRKISNGFQTRNSKMNYSNVIEKTNETNSIHNTI